MKKIIFMGIIMVLVSIPVQATTITTEFCPSNSFASGMGNMFDVNVFDSDLLVTGLDIHTSGDVNGTVNLYTRSGSYLGHETSSDGWTLVDSLEFTPSGAGNATSIDIADFVLTGGITGFYITLSESSFPSTFMHYTVGYSGTTGNSFVDDDNMEIFIGIGLTPGNATPTLFSGNISYARIWNGSIHYELAPSVPEPSTFALMGLGVLGLFGVYRRKTKYFKLP